MKNIPIETLGHFLSTYKTDLEFLTNFKNYKNKKITNKTYVEKSKDSFYKFLIDYKVIRNVKKNNTLNVLKLTQEWINSNQADDVDKFAIQLNKFGLTQEKKIMTSLASKILFLNNPEKIFPLDLRAKKTLKHKSNNYAEYLDLVSIFAQKNKTNIAASLQEIERLYPIIETNFVKDFKNLKKIRTNRFVDKLLWVGENYTK